MWERLSAAEETPAEEPDREPALLQASFILHDFLRRQTNGETMLVDVDLKEALQTGMILLGDARWRTFDAQGFAVKCLRTLVSDVKGAPSGSHRHPPEHVAELSLVIAWPFMREEMGGKVYRRTLGRGRSQLVNDYSGGSLVSERSQELHLRGDMTFQLREKEFTAITGGKISLPSEKVRKTDGTWKVETGEDFAAWLVLRRDGQIFARWSIGLGKDRNTRYLDGEAWSCSSGG